MSCSTDLLIIGGGPAGLNAAINAASEGLSVMVLDDGASPGGQARESNAIENYAGFPDGITGAELMSRMVMQCMKFGVIFQCPCKAAQITRNDEYITVTSEDYQVFTARTVILALGLQYRRLMANGIGALMGRGIYYGMPPFAIPKGKKCLVAIVGGANSAGQAAVRVAENAKSTVHMFIRKTIDLQMSTYLIDRLRASPNVNIYEHAEVTAVYGKSWLKYIEYKQGDLRDQKLDMDNMFIFIGAMPRTMWLDGNVELNEDRYVVSGGGVHPAVNAVRHAMHYETSMPGVFTAGDVRAFATKRISAAVGEGSAVVQQIHQYLASLERTDAKVEA